MYVSTPKKIEKVQFITITYPYPYIHATSL